MEPLALLYHCPPQPQHTKSTRIWNGRLPEEKVIDYKIDGFILH